MPSNKPGKRERYPRAARLVPAEFKLRRARGSKVSKIWFCRKMKSMVEQLYGQRFNKVHKIFLRNRTNKKKDSAEEARPVLQEFRRDLRKALRTTRRRDGSSLDPKWG